ncbi:hypothetical protein J6590_006210 [Homalodisca vitripennis]|nr:hypothetical protein J6590_006210 [Homalodisca vitripennis]
MRSKAIGIKWERSDQYVIKGVYWSAFFLQMGVIAAIVVMSDVQGRLQTAATDESITIEADDARERFLGYRYHNCQINKSGRLQTAVTDESITIFEADDAGPRFLGLRYHNLHINIQSRTAVADESISIIEADDARERFLGYRYHNCQINKRQWQTSPLLLLSRTLRARFLGLRYHNLHINIQSRDYCRGICGKVHSSVAMWTGNGQSPALQVIQGGLECRHGNTRCRLSS